MCSSGRTWSLEGSVTAFRFNPIFGRIGIYALGGRGGNQRKYMEKIRVLTAPVPFDLDNDKPGRANRSFRNSLMRIAGSGVRVQPGKPGCRRFFGALHGPPRFSEKREQMHVPITGVDSITVHGTRPPLLPGRAAGPGALPCWEKHRLRRSSTS